MANTSGVDSPTSVDGESTAHLTRRQLLRVALVTGLTMACGPAAAALTATPRPTAGTAILDEEDGEQNGELTSTPEVLFAQQFIGIVRDNTRSIDGSRLPDTVLRMSELDAAIAGGSVRTADIAIGEVEMVNGTTFSFDLTSNSTIENELTRINLDPLIARVLELGIDPETVLISVTNPGNITSNTIATLDFEARAVNENPGFQSDGFSGPAGHTMFAKLADLMRLTELTTSQYVDPTATPGRHGTEIWIRNLDADPTLATPSYEEITVTLMIQQ